MKSLFRSLFCAVALATLLTDFACPAQAQEGRWELIGPYGGDMTALTVAPSNSRILYAGTRDGKVYRSADGGVSWGDVTGDFPAGRPVDDLEVDPRNPARAYAIVCDPEYYDKPAVGGLFRTVDAGLTWALVDSLDECQVLDVAIDPRNPARIFAGTVSGLYQSNNGGSSWRAQAGRPRLGVVTAVAVDPVTPGAVYAIDYQAGFMRSTNGGATWTVHNAGLSEPRSPLSGLTVSTGGPKTLFLQSVEYGTPLYRSLDGGMTWSPARSGLGENLVNDVAAGASPPRYYAATQGGLFISTNRGATWKAAATPLRYPRVLAVPAGTAGSTVIHAGDAYGILKSRDRGVTWQETNRGLAPLWIESVISAPSDDKVLYTSLGMHTLDGGATWSRDGNAATVLTVHPEEPQTAFGTGTGGIWKTLDAAVSWRRLARLDECVAIDRVVIDPQTPANVYAIGTSPPGCAPLPVCASLKSTDGGRSWSCMEDLPGTVHSFVIAPSQPSTLYALAGYPSSRFYKTVDGGLSWQPSGGDLGLGTYVAALAVSPEDPDTLYAKFNQTAVHSTDGAATWTPIAGLPTGQDFSVFVAPSDASVLYTVTSGTGATALYNSTDAGASWSPLSIEGLPEALRSFQVSRSNPRTVFAATGRGIYRLTVP